MSRANHSYLGIEINASEIHIVEAQGRWPQVQILRAHHAPTPEGVLEGGRITDPVRLGDYVRGMLQLMQAGTRHAVIALPVRSLLTRTLEFPAIPDNEMRQIIGGELAYHHTLREDEDTFDYTPIHVPGASSAGHTMLVMATEARVVQGYREMAQRAGLLLLALEPLPVAMLRALSPQLQAHPDALCVLIQHGDVEIALVEQGCLRMYRRLDISSDDLIALRRDMFPQFLPQSRRIVVNTITGAAGDGEYQDEAEPFLNSIVVQSLAMELQRSLDYYAREFAASRPINSILLATSHPELDALCECLSDMLSLDVFPAALWNDTPVAEIAAFDLKSPLDPLRCGAVGLAMREIPGMPASFPRLNLSRQRPVMSRDTARLRLGIALCASIAILLCGTWSGMRIGLRANQLDHAVSHLQEDILEMQNDKQTRLDALQAHDNLLRVLQREGMAFPRFLDAISETVSPQAALLEISLNRSGQFAIIGEATDGKAIVSMLEGLKRSPYFISTSLNSFDSAQAQSDRSKLVRFQITSQLTGFTNQPDTSRVASLMSPTN